MNCRKCQPSGKIAPREVIQERRAQCRSCQHRTNPDQPMTSVDVCTLCNCPIAALTKQPAGPCRAARWPS
jgi:hypothetical protein